ncbi:MAG: hypothetical protein F6J87_13460 [Spirulina sp. SIO3F2]|nr:hypothetical protein [Spirulina sp. SIO3F2]
MQVRSFLLPPFVHAPEVEANPEIADLSFTPFGSQQKSETTIQFVVEQPHQSIVLAQNSPTSPPITGIGSTLLLVVLNLISVTVCLLVGLWTYRHFYIVTPSNEAFVRTGGLLDKQRTVILNGGCIIISGFHELTRVPLQEFAIDVDFRGASAVQTQDRLRVNMAAMFYVCVNSDEQDVNTAATCLSKQGQISEDGIRDASIKRLSHALRTAAQQSKLSEIDSDINGFADEVSDLVEPELKKVGLTLNNVALSEIRESDA